MAAETISRDEAISRIEGMAKEQGINGPFKVFHKGQLIDTPSTLPDQVDMGDIRVSATMNQA